MKARRVGVIGCGAMGRIHLGTLLERDGVVVSGVTDPSSHAIDALGLPDSIRVYPDAGALIDSDTVDQVVIASPAALHADSLVQAIEAGKAVYCEKPLVTTMPDSVRVRDAESRAGRPLVWVGFMRRFDPAFLALKNDLAGGVLGDISYALLSHRNPSVPGSFGNTDYMLETFIHEFDALRWLLETEVATIEVLSATPLQPESLADPQLLSLTTRDGQHVMIDGHITNGYGYDIRCEVVGRHGSRALVDYADSSGVSPRPYPNWATRFEVAYREALFAWIEDVGNERHTGVGTAEAEAALAIAMAGIRSQQTGARVEVG